VGNEELCAVAHCSAVFVRARHRAGGPDFRLLGVGGSWKDKPRAFDTDPRYSLLVARRRHGDRRDIQGNSRILDPRVLSAGTRLS